MKSVGLCFFVSLFLSLFLSFYDLENAWMDFDEIFSVARERNFIRHVFQDFSIFDLWTALGLLLFLYRVLVW